MDKADFALDFVKAGSSTAALLATTPSCTRAAGADDQGRPDRLRRPGHRRGRAVGQLRPERQARRHGRHVPGPDRRLPEQPQEAIGDKVDVPDDRCFIGFDAYKKVHRQRRRPRDPGHAAGLPADAPRGGRSRRASTSSPRSRSPWTRPASARSSAAAEEAKKKRLAVVAGTQRRHQAGYIETHEADPRRRDRRHRRRPLLLEPGRPLDQAARDGWTDMEWQLRNWLLLHLALAATTSSSSTSTTST